jgi:NhaP-type Na+/H+ or K+/H+ antiporter
VASEGRFAFSIPRDDSQRQRIGFVDPIANDIIIAAFAVVAFSIFAQGLTMPWLIRVLDLTRKTKLAADNDGVAAGP